MKAAVRKQNENGIDHFTETIVPHHLPQAAFTFKRGLWLFGLVWAVMVIIRELLAN